MGNSLPVNPNPNPNPPPPPPLPCAPPPPLPSAPEFSLGVMGNSLPVNPNPNPPNPNPNLPPPSSLPCAPPPPLPCAPGFSLGVMGNSLPVNPNPNPPNTNPNLPPPPPLPCAPPPPPRFLRHSPIRATVEFDNARENHLFYKISCKVIDGLAKLKIFYRSNSKGQIISPEVAFITDRFKVFYDVESRDTLLHGWLNMGRFLSLRATYNVKSRGGNVGLIGKLRDPFYQWELHSSVPSAGLPKTTLVFRNGQVSVEEKATEVLSMSGILRSNVLDGVGTAIFTNDDLSLKYFYKDKELTFIPRISLPSKAFSFAFKQRFSPSDKLSFFYNFKTSDWNAVYKHTCRNNLKFKAGYNFSTYGSNKWACVLVGNEWGRVKSQPFQMRLKLMLQVPQGMNRSVLLFRVKKRWDFDL